MNRLDNLSILPRLVALALVDLTLLGLDVGSAGETGGARDGAVGAWPGAGATSYTYIKYFWWIFFIFLLI